MAKVVYHDGESIKVIFGRWEDKGWAVIVHGEREGDYLLIPKERLLKIVGRADMQQRVKE